MKEAPGPSVSEEIADIFTNYNIDNDNNDNDDNNNNNNNDDDDDDDVACADQRSVKALCQYRLAMGSIKVATQQL